MTNLNKEEQLNQKLEEIDRLIKTKYQEVEDIGILAGLSGLAIFEFYYAHYKDLQESADAGQEILSLAFDHVNEGYGLPTFCSGIAGMGWTMQFLETEDFIEIDCDELLPGLDEYLEESMAIETQENFYDFLHGVLGMAFYFLERYQHTKVPELKEQYRNIISATIKRLRETAVFDQDKAKWESYLIRESKTRGFNLSLAHGISSIVNFLSRVASDPHFQEDAEALLRQAIGYVLSKEHEILQDGCYFPDWEFKDGGIQQSGRLAWCYGDIGVAISLWHAGQALKDDHLLKKAREILISSSRRRKPDETKVVDVGICHGAAGLMHMYQYMYEQTGATELKEAADYWCQQTLDMAIHTQGYAGYMQKRGDTENPWVAELSLLEGIAGIGLSIIAYLSPNTSQWNRSLLIG